MTKHKRYQRRLCKPLFNVDSRGKTTSVSGKREYMRLYMQLMRATYGQAKQSKRRKSRK